MDCSQLPQSSPSGGIATSHECTTAAHVVGTLTVSTSNAVIISKRLQRAFDVSGGAINFSSTSTFGRTESPFRYIRIDCLLVYATDWFETTITAAALLLLLG